MKGPEDQKIEVLDQGFIRLVAYMGSDLAVVRNARGSYDAAWRAGEDIGSDARLIRYLWTHSHTTPFEAATMTFEVYAPIFVFRQWHRHRTQSYNELSARYRPLPEVYYIPDPSDIGIQSSDNKQGRMAAPDLTALREAELLEFIDVCEHAFRVYRKLLASGWPRELARAILPLGTYSHMFATVNLLNAFRFMTLRRDLHAQKEIRVYADAMLELLRPHYPVCCEAFLCARST